MQALKLSLSCLTLLCLFAVCLLIPSIAPAATLQKAEITRIFNEVAVVEPGGRVEPAELQQVVSGSQAVQTGIQSRAELRFTDNTLTRLGANTVFTFQQGTRDMQLNSGTMLLQVPKDAGGAQIRTAAVTASVTGTTVLLEYTSNPNGYCKFTVLEGTMRIFLKSRPGESLLLRPGDMIIMPPNATRIPNPVKIDLKKLVATSGLLSGFDDTENEEELARAVNEQQDELRSGELVDTNVILLGKGNRAHFASDELLSLLDERFAQGETRIERALPVAPLPPIVPTPTPTPTPLPDPALKEGIPATIPGDPYIVNDSTLVITDPIIQTNGIQAFGTIFDPAALGFSSLFTTASPVDGLLTGGNAPLFQDVFATFRFQSLQLEGGFSVDTFEGPTRLVFVGINAIDVVGEVELSASALEAFALISDAGDVTVNEGAGIFMNSNQNLGLIARNGELTILGSLTAGSIIAVGNPAMQIGGLNSIISTPSFTGLSTGPQSYGGRFLVTDFFASSQSDTVNFLGAGSINQAQLFGQNVIFAPGLESGLPLTLNNLLIDAANGIEVQVGSQHSLGTVVLDAPQIRFNGTETFVADSLTIITENAPSSTVMLAPQNFMLQAPTVSANLNGIPLDFDATQQIDLQLLTLNASSDFFSPLNSRSFMLRLGSGGLMAPGVRLGHFIHVGVLPGGDVEAAALSTENLLVQGGDVLVDTLEADLVNVTGTAILQELRGFSTTPASFTFTGNLVALGTGIQIGAAPLSVGNGLSLENGSSLVAGNVQVTGNVFNSGSIDVNGLSVGGSINGTGNIRSVNQIRSTNIIAGAIQIGSGINASGFISADSIRPIAGTMGSYTISSTSLVLPATATGIALDFAGQDGSPGTAGSNLTLQGNSFNFGTGTGQIRGATVAGGDDTVGGNPGAGGSLDIQANTGIFVSNTIDLEARPGAPTTTPPAGTGGQIRLESNGGTINLQGGVRVSDANSSIGGVIQLIANNSTAIDIAGTGGLQAAISGASSGPGGRIMVEATSGTIRMNGTANASGGTVEFRNNANNGGGGIPSITLFGGANITADNVKIGALAMEGVVEIQAGATINADTQALLYGGAAAGGAINFTGTGAVSINSPLTIMRANAVTVAMGTTVNVGMTGFDDIKIFADQRNYSTTGFGDINLNFSQVPNTIGSGSVTGGNYQVGDYNAGSAFPFD